jgi:hypothetical protein
MRIICAALSVCPDAANWRQVPALRICALKCSAIIMVGSFVFALGIDGITDASMTLRPP